MRIRTLGFLVASASALIPGFASADITTDRAAAILIFPRVVASRTVVDLAILDNQVVTDTIIQISNTSTEPVRLHCFYVNATGRCSVSDFACDPSGLSCPDPRDLCLPQWSETDFDVNLTPRQPLAWRASTGLGREDLPLDGRDLSGPDGDSNAGTLVPPVRLRDVDAPAEVVSREFFTGELKCIVVDDTGRGAASNVVKGEATTVSVSSSATATGSQNFVFTARYNAVGVQAIDGDANGDGVLELGGGANEYNGCPNVLIVQHFFDNAFTIVPDSDRVHSELTLVPCTQNLRSQEPGSTTAQFLVFNEFEQRFSTSRRVDCLLRIPLSLIDTPDPERSIFSVGVSGTLGGQTRVRGVQAGLLGVLTESYGRASIVLESGDDAFNLGLQGDRELADRITVPR